MSSVSINKPYVKVYEEKDGEMVIANPIEKKYPGRTFLGNAKDKFGNDEPIFMKNRTELRALTRKMGRNRARTNGRQFIMEPVYSDDVLKGLYEAGQTAISKIPIHKVIKAYNIVKLKFRKVIQY